MSRVSRTGPVAGASMVVALVAVAGCGAGSAHDDDTPRTQHSVFLRSVDAVCTRAVAMHAGHAFPVADFDPENPKPSQLPAVADYFERYGGLPATTKALHALNPPSKDVAVWHDLLADTDAMAANALRQIQAARARDTTSFVATVHSANDLIRQINADGSRLGVSDGSPCHQVFG